MDSLQIKRLPSADFMIAAGFIALGTLSFGWDYLVENQNTYLVHAFRLIDPSFLINDWFSSETHPYHTSFPYLIFILNKLGPLSWTTSFLNSLLIAISLITIWLFMQQVQMKLRLLGFIIIVLVWIGETNSVAGSYIFSPYLQPSTLGGAGFLVGIFAFALNRYFFAGMALAFGGFFHTNYLLLALPVFGIASLASGKENLWRRTTAVCLPSFILFLFILPSLLEISSDPFAAEGARIFTQIRAPWHYLPSAFQAEFYPLFAWCGAAAVCFRTGWLQDKRWRALFLIALVMAICIGIATALTTIIYVVPVAQLYVWRLAPLLVIISALLCTETLFTSDDCGAAILRALGALFLLGFLVALWTVSEIFDRFEDLYVLGGILVLFLCKLAHHWFPIRVDFDSPFFRWSFISIAGLICLLSVLAHLRRETGDLNGSAASTEEQLYKFAAQTAEESIFLIPPDLDNFRLRTGRAILVDWKSTPYLGSELVEWYRRINAIAGKEVKNKDDSEKGYGQLDFSRLKKLRHEYSITYVVLKRKKAYWLPEKDPVFHNEDYLVFRY